MAASSTFETVQAPPTFWRYISGEESLLEEQLSLEVGAAVADSPPAGAPSPTPQPVTGQEDWLSVNEAAVTLGVHENTIRNWVERGILHAARLPSGHRRLPRAEVMRLRFDIFSSLAPADTGPTLDLDDDDASDFVFGDATA